MTPEQQKQVADLFDQACNDFERDIDKTFDLTFVKLADQLVAHSREQLKKQTFLSPNKGYFKGHLKSDEMQQQYYQQIKPLFQDAMTKYFKRGVLQIVQGLAEAKQQKEA